MYDVFAESLLDNLQSAYTQLVVYFLDRKLSQKFRKYCIAFSDLKKLQIVLTLL